MECRLCNSNMKDGVLSIHGAICYSCADGLKNKGDTTMTDENGKTVSVKGKKGKKAPKPVTLRERGVGPNLCINIPMVKENEKLMDAIQTFKTAYHCSTNDLGMLALHKYLGVKTKK